MAIRAKAFQPAKTKAIAEAKEVLQSYNDYIFADYRGLTVEQLSQLRKQLREKECEFKVVNYICFRLPCRTYSYRFGKTRC